MNLQQKKSRFFAYLWVVSLLLQVVFGAMAKTAFAETATFALKIYTSPGDGSVRFWNKTKFVPARNAVKGQNLLASGVNMNPYVEGSVGTNDGTYWSNSRTFLPFDTSVIPQNASITYATLYITGKMNGKSGAISLVKSTQANSTILTDQDYSAIVLTKQANDINTVSFGLIPRMRAWNLNPTGISNIQKGGMTKFAIISANDFNKTEPTVGAANNFGLTGIATSRASEADRPYLEVTYTVDLPAPAPVVTFIPAPAPTPAPRPVLVFSNPTGSALYNQPYQNLSFAIPVNGQYFLGIGDDRNATIYLRSGLNIYISDLQSLGQTKMLEMISAIGLSPTTNYPLYSSGALSDVAKQVQNAGLPLNVNASQGTFIISPTNGTYLVELGRRVFEEKTGIKPETINIRYNISDLRTADFPILARDVSVFKPEITTKNSLNIVKDSSSQYFLVNNEIGTAQKIIYEYSDALVANGIQIYNIATNFDSSFAQALGLNLLSGYDDNAKRFVAYGDANEVITRTISPVNPYGSDLTSSVSGSISKSPSLAQNLAAAGATPAQIAALVSAAPTADQAAQAILDASKGGGQTALAGANYALTPEQLATITGTKYVTTQALETATQTTSTSTTILRTPEAGSLLYLKNESAFVCYISTCKIASTDSSAYQGVVPALPVVPQGLVNWNVPFIDLGTNIFSTSGIANSTPVLPENLRLNVLKQVSAQTALGKINFPAVNFPSVIDPSRWVTQFDEKLKTDYYNPNLQPDEYCLVASGVIAKYPMQVAPNGATISGNYIPMADFYIGFLMASSRALEGISEINNSLAAGLPIIVGVNRFKQPAGSINEHWIVIVGASTESNGAKFYNFYDAGTANRATGTLAQAQLFLDEKTLTLSGKRQYTTKEHPEEVFYTVTSVLTRP